MSRNRLNSSDARPLFDPKQPKGVIFYPFYRVPEVSQIMGIGPDKIRSLCREGYFGEVIRIENQTRRHPHKRNRTTFLIPASALLRILPEIGNSAVR